jgi:hypothetical protein
MSRPSEEGRRDGGEPPNPAHRRGGMCRMVTGSWQIARETGRMHATGSKSSSSGLTCSAFSANTVAGW